MAYDKRSMEEGVRSVQGSLIISFLTSVFIKLRRYYENSMTCDVLNRIAQFFLKMIESSVLVQFFLKDWKEETAWRNSFIHKLITWPVKSVKGMCDKLRPPMERSMKGSILWRSLSGLFNNLLTVSVRVFGLMLLAFTLTEGILWMLLRANNLKGIALRAVLLGLSFGLIWLNRSVAAFYRGSKMMQFAAGFFTPSESGIPGVEDEAKRAESPGLRASNVREKIKITAVVIGVLLGILGFVLPFSSFVKVVGAVGVAIAILWKVEIGVFLVVAFTPFSPGTMPLVGLVLLCALSLGIRLLTDSKFNLTYSPLDTFILLFTGAVIYGSVTSFAFQNSTKIALVYVAFILFYILLVNTIKTKRQLYGLVVLLVLSALLVGLYGIYQYYFGVPTTQSWIDEEMFEDLKVRVYATWENPNVLGEYLVILIPIALALFWTAKKWIYRLIYGGITAVLLLCMLFTLSRGSWLGLILALGIFAVLRDRRLVVLGVIGILILPFVLPASFIDRFSSIGNLQDTSTNYRVSIWIGSLKIIGDYWPSGIGLGAEAFSKIYPRYALAGAAFALHAHNFYLQILVETGVVGLLSFLLVIFIFYKNVLASYWKTKDYFLSTFMVALSAGMAGYLLNGLFDNIWYNYRMVLFFWTMIALGMIAVRLANAGDTTKARADIGGA
ncbi:MAG: O-antigen ligase family protein [Firmicutes bacterium]|nr:O-antigen ligase family protein [Bacillota bacterium]